MVRKIWVVRNLFKAKQQYSISISIVYRESKTFEPLWPKERSLHASAVIRARQYQTSLLPKCASNKESSWAYQMRFPQNTSNLQSRRFNTQLLMEEIRRTSTTVVYRITCRVLYIPGGLPDFWTINSIISSSWTSFLAPETLCEWGWFDQTLDSARQFCIKEHTMKWWWWWWSCPWWQWKPTFRIYDKHINMTKYKSTFAVATAG